MTIDILAPTYFADDTKSQIARAHSYFEEQELHLLAPGDLDPTIQDMDGLVSYIVASSNQPPDEIKELYEQVSPIMEGLTNVVVSAILKKAGTNDSMKHDPQVWKEPMQAMAKAFCSGFSQSTQHYDQTIRGVTLANKFLNILMDAVVNQGAAFNEFRKFLQSQGETIRLETNQSTNKYLYASVSIVHEIFQASDGRWIYVPKFKSYFTSFTKETLKLSSGCASYDQFKFKFDLDVMTGAFMVDNWKNFPSFRNQVRDFIEKFQKTNIKDTENYFQGIFDSGQTATLGRRSGPGNSGAPHSSAKPEPQTFTLAFEADKGVTSKDVDKFCAQVKNDAKSVAEGLVSHLKAEGVKAEARHKGSGWEIVVHSPDEREATGGGEEELGFAEDGPPIRANITFRATGRDIPPVINALNRFFSNWRAVRGLIAVGAAATGAYCLVMKVRRTGED